MFPLVSHGLEYVSIGDNFDVCARLRLEAYSKHLDNIYTPELIIGDNVSINYDCHIGCVNKVVIGNNVLIASKVFITDHFHGEITYKSLKLAPNLRKVISKGPVIIEDNVWIGEGVAIMPNVTIGKNSIIGANAVVTKDVPKNSVVGGNPARLIKNININKYES
ncbi:MAG: acyltransferase [Campylobacteraceae bacterium]|nr:acyltransferase [Campylobacteraceae bacterium]